MSEFDKMLKKEINKLVDQRMNAQNLISKVDDLKDQCNDLENGIAGLEDKIDDIDTIKLSTKHNSVSYYKDTINIFIKELIELRNKL